MEFYVILHLTDRDALKEISMVIKNHIAHKKVCKMLDERYQKNIYKNTHTHTFNGPLSGTTQVSRHQNQKSKTNLDFTEARVSDSGISWVICKSAPRCRQPCQQFFTGWGPSLPPNQQRQSTEGKYLQKNKRKTNTKQKSLQLLLQLKQTFII